MKTVSRGSTSMTPMKASARAMKVQRHRGSLTTADLAVSARAGSKAALLVPPRPALQQIDHQQHGERRRQHHDGDRRRRACIVVLLELGDDQQRRDSETIGMLPAMKITDLHSPTARAKARAKPV